MSTTSTPAELAQEIKRLARKYADTKLDRFGPRQDLRADPGGAWRALNASINRAVDRLAALAEARPSEARVPLSEELHTFLNAAAAEGYVLDGVDAADIYIKTFPERYNAAVAAIDREPWVDDHAPGIPARVDSEGPAAS